MIVLVSRFFLRKKFTGMTLWPFVILRNGELKEDIILMNHERIHLRQQLELLVIPFFVFYGIEFLVRLFQYRNRYEAYKNISFEREAYANEEDLPYLKRRSFWSFIGYY